MSDSVAKPTSKQCAMLGLQQDFGVLTAVSSPSVCMLTLQAFLNLPVLTCLAGER